MYQFEFEIPDGGSIIIMGDTYNEALEKIIEIDVPHLNIKTLLLISILETYDDAMYFEPEFDIDEDEE